MSGRGGWSGLKGGGGGGALPETISNSITIAGRQYDIENNKVTYNTVSAGKVTVEVNGIRELDKKTIQNAKKAGYEDPVMVGRYVMERKAAQTALSNKDQAYQNYKTNLAKNVPGLEEIERARIHNDREARKQTASIDRGERLYKANTIDITGLRKKYPRADAYLKAGNYANASNYRKASLGREAQKKIRQGKSYKKAIAEMEAEWKKYTSKAVWD